jgi:hypothetical protein
LSLVAIRHDAYLCLLAGNTRQFKERNGSPLTRHRSQLRKEIPDVDQVVIENVAGIVQHPEDRWVLNRVKDVLPFLAGQHDAALAQHGELLRYRGLFDPKPLTEIAYADLALAEGVKYFDPQRVAKRLKELSRELR